MEGSVMQKERTKQCKVCIELKEKKMQTTPRP